MSRFTRVVFTSLLCLVISHRVFAHGDVHEQIQEVTKRIKADPKNALLYHKRGELHRAHAEYAEALADYAQAEKLDPKLDVVFLSRGRALFESEKFTAALDALNTFLTKQPEHNQARWLRGQVLVKLNKRDDAEKDFREALKSGDPSPDQYAERAKNLRDAGRNRPALTVLEEGIQRLGSLITLELPALDLEVALKDYKAAQTRIDALIANAERKETYLVRKAEILEQMGKKPEAQKCYADALQAIAALPERQRKLKSTAQLEEKVRMRQAQNRP